MTYLLKEIEELKRRVPAWKVVADRVSNLRKDGAEYVCLCPFHTENTPSFKCFQVDDGTWLWKCFGCNKSGNVFQFVQEFDRIGFNEAVDKVASLAGWQGGKERVESAFQEIIGREERKLTFPLSKLAEAESALTGSPAAREWLAGRGLTLETARRFHLGYVQSAAAVNPNHEWVGDGWIVFPTVEGETVTLLKYRSVRGKRTPSGESGILRKSGMATPLFNAQAVEPFDDVFVVEGEPDCMVMVQAGYPCVALPMAGFSPTPEMRDRMMQANTVYLAGDMDPAGRQAMSKLWTELRDRTFLVEWPEGCKDANDCFLRVCDGNVEKFKTVVESLKRRAHERPMPFMYSLRETLRHADSTRPSENPARLRFPWPSIDRAVAVLPTDLMCMFATEPKTGKALAHGTPVLTTRGFVAIEEIRIGDYVFGLDGRPTKVLGVFPQGERDAYAVSFSSGTTVVCDADHLWTVERKVHKLTRETLTTVEIAHRRFAKPYRLPKVSPVEFGTRVLPIDPYLLGVLIGDGGLTHISGSVKVSSTDREVLERTERLLPDSLRLNFEGRCTWRIAGRAGHRNSLKQKLAGLGLLGKSAEHKHIPAVYFLASVEQRLELLRGLLDTDGTVDRRKGSVSFCTSSPQLAQDVRSLVFSLGGFSRIRTKKTLRLPAFNLSINMPRGTRLFWLSRKHRLALRRKGRERVCAVSYVVPVGRRLMTCIKVAAEDGLFLTTDYLPTHNTAWLMNVLLENAVRQGRVVVNFSAELSPEQYARRAAAHLLRRDKDLLGKQDFLTAADLMGEARFYNGYKPGANYREVVDLVLWAKRRLGADIVAIDHLHFLTRSERDETKAQSEALRMLKDLAIEYNVVVIVVGQPRKPQANMRGREAVAQDAKGSEAFGSDASQLFILHRNRKQGAGDDDVDIFEPETRVKLDYSRESGTWVKRLFFNGAQCTFYEMAPGEGE